MWRRSHRLFLEEVGGEFNTGSPYFRSPEVGISIHGLKCRHTFLLSF